MDIWRFNLRTMTMPKQMPMTAITVAITATAKIATSSPMAVGSVLEVDESDEDEAAEEAASVSQGEEDL